LSLPTKQGAKFEDKEEISPLLNTTSKHDERKAFGLREAQFVDLAMQDNKLLSLEGILGKEDVAFGAAFDRGLCGDLVHCHSANFSRITKYARLGRR
jgi:hypothetical protein